LARWLHVIGGDNPVRNPHHKPGAEHDDTPHQTLEPVATSRGLVDNGTLRLAATANVDIPAEELVDIPGRMCYRPAVDGNYAINEPGALL
jgi:hypothetical protein